MHLPAVDTLGKLEVIVLPGSSIHNQLILKALNGAASFSVILDSASYHVKLANIDGSRMAASSLSYEDTLLHL